MSGEKVIEREYIAFISYRHRDLDKKAAEKIQRAIESYVIPKELREHAGGKKLGMVFRDEDELPASSSLSDSITYALDHTKYLIVICTPDLPKSKWCEQEIRYFLSTHDRDHILAVLVDGDPEEAFSPYLLHTFDEEGNITGDTEPLAANIAGRNHTIDNKAFKKEIVRVYAALLGVPFDALWQRERRKRTMRLLSLMSLAAAILAVFLAMTISKNIQITRQSRELQRQLSTIEVDSGLSLLEDYDIKGALQKGLNALLDEEGRELYDHRAKSLLNKALGSYTYDELRSRILYEQSTDIRAMDTAREESLVLVMDAAGLVRCISSEDGSLVWERSLMAYKEAGTADPALLPADRKDLVLCRCGRTIAALSLEDGSRVWTKTFETGIPAAVWALSPDQSLLVTAVIDREEGKKVLLTGLDAGSGEEKGAVEIGKKGYETVLEEEDPSYRIALAFSEDGAGIGCAFYGNRLDEEGYPSGIKDCFYQVLSPARWEVLHESSWEREEKGSQFMFGGIRVDAASGNLLCFQYDYTFGGLIMNHVDWDKKEADIQLTDYTIRSNDGSGTVSTMDRPVVCPMLSDAFNTLVMFDNTAFLFETSTGALKKSYVFGDTILYARWLDREEETAEILTADGKGTMYDFSPDADHTLEEYVSDGYDQKDLRFCFPAGDTYVTVREERPGRILLVDRVSDPEAALVLPREAAPDYAALSPSGARLMLFYKNENLDVICCDPGTGEVLESRTFEGGTSLSRGVRVLDESRFMIEDTIFSMDGSMTKLEVPENVHLGWDIRSLCLPDGRIFTAADQTSSLIPLMNLCWVDGKLLPGSNDWASSLAFKDRDSFTLAAGGYYVGWGTCGIKDEEGNASMFGPGFAAFGMEEEKRILIDDPETEAGSHVLAGGRKDPVFACGYDTGRICLGHLDTGELSFLDLTYSPGEIQTLCFTENDDMLLVYTASGRLDLVRLSDEAVLYSGAFEEITLDPDYYRTLTCAWDDTGKRLHVFLRLSEYDDAGVWNEIDTETWTLSAARRSVYGWSREKDRILSGPEGNIVSFPVHDRDDLGRMAEEALQ